MRELNQLAFVDKVWILSGYCRLRQDQRVFRLDRIDDLQVRSERFTPRDLEIPRSFARRIKVVVRVDASVLRWVQERQHYTFAEDETAETSSTSGDDDAIMVYRPFGFEQIEGWLLSWGDNIEVLEPPALRERIAATAANIVRRHQ